MQVSSKSPIEASGRGARFLSLVKQNKLNVSPQLVHKRRFSMCDRFEDRDGAKHKNSFELKEYLQFSVQIKHDPDASPSSSILSKRKADSGTSYISPLTSSMKVNSVWQCWGFLDYVWLISSVSVLVSVIQFPRRRNIWSPKKRSVWNPPVSVDVSAMKATLGMTTMTIWLLAKKMSLKSLKSPKL